MPNSLTVSEIDAAEPAFSGGAAPTMMSTPSTDGNAGQYESEDQQGHAADAVDLAQQHEQSDRRDGHA
ncbi:MAG: hypothetical protein M3443_09890, partial [Actinomycetota bacterium]|nr:hypothetical protein [Actinomycetota bacterium]